MPTVMIYQLPRPAELKRQAAAAVTQSIGDAYGVAPEQVQVYFCEAGGESWAIGGRLASDAGPDATPAAGVAPV